MTPENDFIVYVSYADADEEWVVHFVNSLKVYLRKGLGELDDNFIGAKYMLRGSDNRQQILQQHLQCSKYLLVILSPAYLRTIRNSEIDSFGKTDNLILVEHSKVNLLEKLQSFHRYQFWHEDARGQIISLANPVPTLSEPQYYRLMAEIAQYIIKRFGDQQKLQLSDISTTDSIISRSIPSQQSLHVFINATEQDRALAIDIQRQLGTEINSSMLPARSVGLTVKEREEYLNRNLLDCNAVIIVCGRASLKWTYQQLQYIYKIQSDRRGVNKSDFKMVAIFNKPPPDDLGRELGLQFPNLRIWNCADIINECVPEFKQVAFS